MKKVVIFSFVVLIAAVVGIGSLMADEKKMGQKPISKEKLIKLALSAAPLHIAENATVMIPGDDGKLMEARKGTNGFTCIPTVNNRPGEPDPMCFDAAVGQWVEALQNKAPKPTNTVPGISYMARGGMHWEKDGKTLMDEEPGATMVKEPPHWMVMWAFDSKTSGFPSVPNPGGTYVMFDGTPYAHLMVYQNPYKMK